MGDSKDLGSHRGQNEEVAEQINDTISHLNSHCLLCWE